MKVNRFFFTFKKWPYITTFINIASFAIITFLILLGLFMQFTFHYWLKNSEGEVVDSSQGGEPLTLKKGSGKIVQGLEDALVSHNAGDKFEVLVPCDKAYGKLNESLVSRLPLTSFDSVESLSVGMMFQTGEGKDAVVVKIVHIDDQGVIVDGNHPLAGLDLNFQVELIQKEG